MPHAYYITGENEEALAEALSFVERELGLSHQGNPDVIVRQHGLFRVEDARLLLDTCISAPIAGDRKVVIVSATRFFHETQNALLKIFEEPPAGTTLILVLPTEGLLVPTLRSRLTRLPSGGRAGKLQMGELAQTFLDEDDKGREKLIDKLIDRTKADNDEEKQRARAEAVQLAEDLMRFLTEGRRSRNSAAVQSTLADIDHFLPLLHTRSAPLKPIFEHIRLVWRDVESPV